MTLTTDTAAPGCCDPALGVQARANLGRSLSEQLREHLAACLACRLERLAFERFVQASEPAPSISTTT